MYIGTFLSFYWIGRISQNLSFAFFCLGENFGMFSFGEEWLGNKFEFEAMLCILCQKKSTNGGSHLDETTQISHEINDSVLSPGIYTLIVTNSIDKIS